jgi:MOSC domain-containing protein YiiM
MAEVLRVNVKGRPTHGSGLGKHAVVTARLSAAGVAGDFNRYRHERLADDPDSAVLLLPMETIDQLNAEGWPVRAGDLGENLTVRGVPYASLAPGTVVRVGPEAVVQVSRACDPCDNLVELPYVGKERGAEFMRTMRGRRGWYARVLVPGRVAPGDVVAVGGPGPASAHRTAAPP